MITLRICTFLGLSTMFSGVAHAQMPLPTANYSGEMQMSSVGADPVTMLIYKQGASQRLEIPTPNGIMVSLINTDTRNAYSFPKSDNGPMGTQALRIDYDKIASRLNANIANNQQAVKIGSSAVSGQYCTLYQIETGTACLTGDGILMRMIASNGNKMELTALSRGAQASNIFKVPDNYALVDISSGIPDGMVAVSSSEIGNEPDDFQMDSFMAEQAGKQVKREIKSLARDQIGSSIGGAIGGSLIGGTIGNEASKAVTGIVGGLFGKKKKQAKDAKLESETAQAAKTEKK